jgi:3-deoxy-D-manno-octulosonate 8-phosphate phosphatase (KDO 8-P phosphatase)
MMTEADGFETKPNMTGRIPPGLKAKLARVKLLLCDVDGVLTDASVFIGGAVEIKRFNILDGLGLVILRRSGIKVGWISNRPSEATAARAMELKIDYVLQQKDSKVGVIERLLLETRYSWDEVCYTGDDVVDIGPLKRAGCGIAVNNAVAEAKAAADHVTLAAGGYGAVREIVELILRAQGKWDNIIAEYSA